MTIVARRIVATPARAASEAWGVILELVAPELTSSARKELECITGIATSLIADETLNDFPAVVYVSGPRLRLYCLYGEAAISGDNASESVLAFNPTGGDWQMSLPCPEEDIEWVNDALKKASSRVRARAMGEDVEEDGDSDVRKSSTRFELDKEAFFTS
ncbi:MAG: hypothetical protein AABN95_15340 [Acidobacteriota bacterium]